MKVNNSHVGRNTRIYVRNRLLRLIDKSRRSRTSWLNTLRKCKQRILESRREIDEMEEITLYLTGPGPSDRNRTPSEKGTDYPSSAEDQEPQNEEPAPMGNELNGRDGAIVISSEDESPKSPSPPFSSEPLSALLRSPDRSTPSLRAVRKQVDGELSRPLSNQPGTSNDRGYVTLEPADDSYVSDEV